MKTVAVLCTSKNSIYKSLKGVEVYDEKRDARTFAGGMPIVAHPPCRAWSAFCRHQAKPKDGEKELGPACVVWLEKCGGVLEHPAHSTLWEFARLPRPGSGVVNGMWTLAVQQAWWGDTRTKNTWLLFSKIDPMEVETPFKLHNPNGDRRRWQVMSKTQRAATSIEFAEWLVGIARLV